jgi:hypothetical protein
MLFLFTPVATNILAAAQILYADNGLECMVLPLHMSACGNTPRIGWRLLLQVMQPFDKLLSIGLCRNPVRPSIPLD